MKKIDKELIRLVLTFAIGLAAYLINGKYTTLAAAIILFVIGLFLLIKGGDSFVEGATSIAEKFHIPEVLIGATVVSIGTTLPEVMVSAQAAAKGASAISYGNALGSIICNVSLIAAITLAVKPAVIDRKPLVLPVVFFFIAAAVYVFNAYAYHTYSRMTGIILLCIFVVYMVLVITQAMKGNKNSSNKVEAEAEPEEEKKDMPIVKAIIYLVMGAAIITFGAGLLVDNGTIIAKEVGIPETVIALVFVALGTSLPELVTAITSLVKGHGALSVGNVIGANLFNLVLVSGLAITIKPFGVPGYVEGVAKLPTSLLVDIPVAMGVMIVLTVPALIKSKMYRWQGILLLLTYFGFCAYQFLG